MKTTARLWLVQHPHGSADVYRTLREAMSAARRANLPVGAISRDCSAPHAGHSADYIHRIRMEWASTARRAL